MPRPRIFVSHSNNDPPAQDWLDRISEVLDREGFEVLLDRKRLTPGSSWRDEIYSWLGLCHGAVVLVSDAAVRPGSIWVPRETSILLWRRTLEPDLVVVPVCLLALALLSVKFSDAIAAVEVLAEFLDSAKADQLLAIVSPSWVDLCAARWLAECATRGENKPAAVLNASTMFSAQMYVYRAGCRPPKTRWPVVPITAVHGERVADELCGEVEASLISEFRLDEDPFSQNLKARLRAMMDERQRLRKPVFVALKYSPAVAAELGQLQRAFPAVTLFSCILLSGDQFPPEAQLITCLTHCRKSRCGSTDAASGDGPPHEPYRRSRWSRCSPIESPAIISGALATPSLSGPLDLTKVIEAVSRAEFLSSVPCQKLPTLVRGVQLLLDSDESMQPFAKDQSIPRAALTSVVGRDHTEVLYFEGSPLRGAGTALQEDWADYRAPARATPVVLVTDLGIGRPPSAAAVADESEWLQFARLVARAQCPVAALVPYPPKRWPPALSRHMTIIQWDRTTTAASVRRIVGAGLTVKKDT